MKPLSRNVLPWLAMLFLGSFVLPPVQAQSIQVDSANPNSAEQGTVDLDVEISGSGFDNSAIVDFFVTGTTNPGGIVVKNVKVRGSKKIIATIDVTDGATVDDFDIEVRLSTGRKGKGTTLFKVQAKPTGKPADEYYSDNEGVQFISPSDVAGFDYHIIGTPDRDDIYAGAGRDLIEGGDTRDYLYGRGNDDELRGGAGGDILFGEEGRDLLIGDAGEDWMDGGPGTDVLLGGSGPDFLFFSLGDFIGTSYELDVFDGGADLGDWILFRDDPDVDGVVVDLGLATYQATVHNTALGTIVVSGNLISIDSVWGSRGNDTLRGTPGDDGLAGADGDDFLDSGAGNDDVVGEGGNDLIYLGPGDDQVRGDGGADQIYAGDGNDIIELFADDGSPDLVSGGAGCDLFVFGGRFGEDTVTDFDDACDVIDLSDFNPKYRLDYNDLSISASGDDIIIFFWFQKQGGAGGTIILKDAVANGVVLDSSDFVFE